MMPMIMQYPQVVYGIFGLVEFVTEMCDKDLRVRVNYGKKCTIECMDCMNGICSNTQHLCNLRER